MRRAPTARRAALTQVLRNSVRDQRRAPLIGGARRNPPIRAFPTSVPTVMRPRTDRYAHVTMYSTGRFMFDHTTGIEITTVTATVVLTNMHSGRPMDRRGNR